jgi:hypothetical protein
MPTDIEIKFIDSIDCNFPYHDRQKCLRLIDEAAGISVNAIFSVTEEICRIPVSEKEKVQKSYLLDLLAYTKDKFEHPIKEIIFDTADKMIREQDLTVDEVIKGMEIIKEYRGQFAALSILYFSCDDKDEKLEPMFNQIRSDWNK